MNRPFDDQTNDKIRLESEAILSIFAQIETKSWNLLGSDIIDLEIGKIPDQEKKEKVLSLLQSETIHIELNEKIISRASVIEGFGISPFDALHISSSESVNANVFLTTDNNIIKKYQINESQFKISIKNPINWLMEVI
ncbi:MAG: PIN domain-containing protein [Promethearchaeota archaeon]